MLSTYRLLPSHKHFLGIFLLFLIGGIIYTNTLVTCAANDDTIQVKIKLPHQFIEMAQDAGINLLEHIRLEGCENARFYSSSTNNFVTQCEKQPIKLIINGFKPIYYFHRKNNIITFNPQNLIAPINISTKRTYYFKNASLAQIRAVVDNQILSLSYQNIGQDLLFRVKPFLDSPCCDLIKRISLVELMQGQHSLSLEPNIKYNENYAVYQFPNKTACRKGTNPISLSRYTQAKLQAIKFTPGTYVKLFDELNGKPASRCTLQQNQLNFKPYECEGKRQLIVVSTGEQLNHYGGRQIPQTMFKVFQKNLNTRIPFTLVTIKSGRKLSEPLLRCEDLADLDESEAQAFIWRRLAKIRFGAYDLRALQDLDLVNFVYPKEKLQRVLYLTDNNNIPANISQINDKHLSVPLITWKRAGIQLKVLTTGSCSPWTERAEAEKCQELQNGEAIQQIQGALQAFIGNAQ